MKKKILALLLVATMACSVVACGGTGNSENAEGTGNKESEESSKDTETKEETITYYEVGDTAQSDSAEIQLSAVEFQSSYSFVTPKEGNSFVVVTFSLKNIGKTDFKMIKYPDGSESIMFKDIVSVDYNDGYIFDVDDVEGKDGKNYSYDCLVTNPHKYITELKPLSEGMEATVAIVVPDEVVTNESAPLLIKATVPSSEGTETFVYKVR